MEDALVPVEGMTESFTTVIVLILVLMEDALVLIWLLNNKNLKYVLILVLMEDALVQFTTMSTKKLTALS